MNQKRSLAKLDQSLKEVDLKAVVELTNLNFAALTNATSDNMEKPRYLMQVSTDPIILKAIKKSRKFGVEALGIKFMT